MTVYRLVTAGSVEESIVQMQQRKRALGNAVLGDDGLGGEEAGEADEALGEEDDFELDEGTKKMDVAMMSSLIENALGLFSS